MFIRVIYIFLIHTKRIEQNLVSCCFGCRCRCNYQKVTANNNFHIAFEEQLPFFQSTTCTCTDTIFVHTIRITYVRIDIGVQRAPTFAEEP